MAGRMRRRAVPRKHVDAKGQRFFDFDKAERRAGGLAELQRSNQELRAEREAILPLLGDLERNIHEMTERANALGRGERFAARRRGLWESIRAAKARKTFMEKRLGLIENWLGMKRKR
jgi:chromosome condensin MukBEF ATPase and DNA-binding subunit MukB